MSALFLTASWLASVGFVGWLSYRVGLMDGRKAQP